MHGSEKHDEEPNEDHTTRSRLQRLALFAFALATLGAIVAALVPAGIQAIPLSVVAAIGAALITGIALAVEVFIDRRKR